MSDRPSRKRRKELKTQCKNRLVAKYLQERKKDQLTNSEVTLLELREELIEIYNFKYKLTPPKAYKIQQLEDLEYLQKTSYDYLLPTIYENFFRSGFGDYYVIKGLDLFLSTLNGISFVPLAFYKNSNSVLLLSDNGLSIFIKGARVGHIHAIDWQQWRPLASKIWKNKQGRSVVNYSSKAIEHCANDTPSFNYTKWLASNILLFTLSKEDVLRVLPGDPRYAVDMVIENVLPYRLQDVLTGDKAREVFKLRLLDTDTTTTTAILTSLTRQSIGTVANQISCDNKILIDIDRLKAGEARIGHNVELSLVEKKLFQYLDTSGSVVQVTSQYKTKIAPIRDIS